MACHPEQPFTAAQEQRIRALIAEALRNRGCDVANEVATARATRAMRPALRVVGNTAPSIGSIAAATALLPADRTDGMQPQCGLQVGFEPDALRPESH